MKGSLPYYPQLDLLRFVAVLAVIASHWRPESWVDDFQLGRLGVDLFFVISGFLISRILLVQKQQNKHWWPKLKTFFIRRVLRIFPIYYTVVLIGYFFTGGHFQEAILWNLSYTSNFYMLQLDQFAGTMSHFWSLSVEEHFYLLWPLLILLSPRKRLWSVMIFMLLLGVGSRLFFYTQGYSLLNTYIFTSSCFDALAGGGLLALYLFKRPDLQQAAISRRTQWLSIGGGCLLLFCSFTFHASPYFTSWENTVLLRLLSTLVFIQLISHLIRSSSSILRQPQLVLFGKLSYSMYLWHNLIPGLLLGVKPFLSSTPRFILYLIILMLLSYGSYRLIELPFNQLKKRFAY